MQQFEDRPLWTFACHIQEESVSLPNPLAVYVTERWNEEMQRGQQMISQAELLENIFPALEVVLEDVLTIENWLIHIYLNGGAPGWLPALLSNAFIDQNAVAGQLTGFPITGQDIIFAGDNALLYMYDIGPLRD